MASPAKQESNAALRDYLLQEKREFRTRMCSILERQPEIRDVRMVAAVLRDRRPGRR
jgi:hypothetical protein